MSVSALGSAARKVHQRTVVATAVVAATAAPDAAGDRRVSRVAVGASRR